MPRQLMIGLPASGKTTFLAALWALLNAPTAETALALHRYSGVRDRLERLAEKWLAGEEFGRTEMQNEGWVDLFLGPKGGKETTKLTLPDLSGENFESQWRDRRCGTDYQTAAREADGVLLFIHAKKIKVPRNIAEINADVRALLATEAVPDGKATPEGGVIAADPGSGTASSTTQHPLPDTAPSATQPTLPNTAPGQMKPIPWHADLAPTQVKVVDLLQILCEPSMGGRRRRLAVVLSAWDLVSGLGWKPASYLRELMPMLDQYLHTNAGSFEPRIFGVSCQGMDRSDPGFRRAVGRLPEQRILVEDDHSVGYDLTRVLSWTNGDG